MRLWPTSGHSCSPAKVITVWPSLARSLLSHIGIKIQSQNTLSVQALFASIERHLPQTCPGKGAQGFLPRVELKSSNQPGMFNNIIGKPSKA